MSRPPIRNFVEMLGLLSRGKFVDKCNEHLTTALETLEAGKETGLPVFEGTPE